MLLKLLKLNANDEIISGATATSRSGSVTHRNTCQAPPPSTRAASVSSSGIDWSAPSETRKKYGVVSQTETRITVTRAQLASKSHGTLTPTCERIDLLTTPKSSFRRPPHTSSERKPGIAYGMIRIDRYVRWKRMPRLSSVIARKRPAANENSTVSPA